MFNNILQTNTSECALVFEVGVCMQSAYVFNCVLLFVVSVRNWLFSVHFCQFHTHSHTIHTCMHAATNVCNCRMLLNNQCIERLWWIWTISNVWNLKPSSTLSRFGAKYFSIINGHTPTGFDDNFYHKWIFWILLAKDYVLFENALWIHYTMSYTIYVIASALHILSKLFNSIEIKSVYRWTALKPKKKIFH